MSKNVEGKLVLDYVYGETKKEEFLINSMRVSELLFEVQFEKPNTLRKFLNIMNGLLVRTEEQAEEALLKLEEIVAFPNKEVKVETIKYLYLIFDPFGESESIMEWLEDLVEDDNGEIISRKWVDLETFKYWLSQDYYANIILDWYYFKNVEEFYEFMLMCKQHGVTYIWCDETGIELQGYFDSLSLLYLMCDKNEVEEERIDWGAGI